MHKKASSLSRFKSIGSISLKMTDMNTLVNGSPPGEDAQSPRVGLASYTFPEARKSSQTGVSVEYVRSDERQWFVLRAPYAKELLAADLFIDAGIYAYVPRRKEIIEKNGKHQKRLVSLLPSLLFVYLTQTESDLFVKGLDRLLPNSLTKARNLEAQLSQQTQSYARKLSSITSFYYNHFKFNTTGHQTNVPLTVSEADMYSFVRATYTQSSHLKVVETERCRFLDNKMVEVVSGDYTGVRGRVARIAGQQVIVVSLANGEFNISTDYIPTPCIRIIEENA